MVERRERERTGRKGEVCKRGRGEGTVDGSHGGDDDVKRSREATSQHRKRTCVCV